MHPTGSGFFRNFVSMKRYLLFVIFLLPLLPSQAQTIIELGPGGGVRSKNVEDYRKEEPGMKEKLKADSLQYKDNLTRAFNALYRDSLQVAESLLTEALKLRPQAPGNYIVRHYLGKIAMAHGQYRKAIGLFTELLKEHTNNIDIRFDRASCYLEIQNAKAAMLDCEAIQRQQLNQEQRHRLLFLRSAVHTAERHPEKAKLDLEEILREDSDNESALILLALVYEDLGQHAEALHRLDIFVGTHPQSVDGLLARAEMAERQNMYEAARADYDKAIQLQPDNATLYTHRARLLEKMDLPRQAQNDLKKAEDLRNRHVPPTATNP